MGGGEGACACMCVCGGGGGLRKRWGGGKKKNLNGGYVQVIPESLAKQLPSFFFRKDILPLYLAT